MSQPDSTTAAGRRLLQQGQFDHLAWLLDEIHALRQIGLDDDQLELLSIRKLPAIDVDEVAVFDPEPLFLQPYRLDNDALDFPTVVADALYDDAKPKKWTKSCTRDKCNSYSCANWRSTWVVESFGDFGEGIRENTEWEEPTRGLCDPDAYCCAPDIGGRYQWISFLADAVFRVAGGNKPHTAMAVSDWASSNPRTLTSEIVTAISVLLYRLRHGQFVDHHTIPVFVYSFLHDKFARITQAYMEGSLLLLRQSRLLDLQGGVPTDDAYLLLRWVAGRAVGTTRYQTIQEHVSPDAAGQPRPLAEALSIQA